MLTNQKYKIDETHEINATFIKGDTPGKRLIITAGVHGCEYVGVRAALDIIKELSNKAIKGEIIIIPIVNTEGFYAGAKQIVPTDGKNLNRVFPGDKNGSISEKIAYFIENTFYPGADFLIDLHSGDVNESLTPLVFYPNATDDKTKQTAKDIAQYLSVEYRVASSSKNGLYSWAVQKGVPALLIERGCMGLWSSAEITKCKNDIYAVLDRLDILKSNAKINTNQIDITKAVYPCAESCGLWYCYVKRGEKVKQGDIIGELKDINDNIITKYTAEFDGIMLYYTLSLGVNEGDSLFAFAKI